MQQLAGCRPVLGVEGHHLGDELLGRGGNGALLAVLYLAVGDQPVELLLVAGSEGKDANQHQVKDDSQGPNVRLCAVVRDLADELRTHVGRCAAEVVEIDAGRGAEAKVYDLDAALLVDQNVLGLQVAVANAFLVAVADTVQNLLEVSLCHFLGQDLFFPQQPS